jgi:hypothetical protein
MRGMGIPWWRNLIAFLPKEEELFSGILNAAYFISKTSTGAKSLGQNCADR